VLAWNGTVRGSKRGLSRRQEHKRACFHAAGASMNRSTVCSAIPSCSGSAICLRDRGFYWYLNEALGRAFGMNDPGNQTEDFLGASPETVKHRGVRAHDPDPAVVGRDEIVRTLDDIVCSGKARGLSRGQARCGGGGWAFPVRRSIRQADRASARGRAAALCAHQKFDLPRRTRKKPFSPSCIESICSAYAVHNDAILGGP
jgi:hypothetical protein